MNTKLYRKDNSFIRVLAENDCNLLVMDCINKTMPKWINEPLNSFTECVEDDLRAFLGICFDDMENLNPKSKKTMYERYTIISGVITLIQDNYLRNKAIDTIAKEQNISKQTIRKYLCMYLSYMDIRALAPDDCSRKKELSSDEKNIRYALNKFFYNKNKNTLKYAYRMMLKEKYCDNDGKLIEEYPSFYQFRYFYRKNKNLQTYYISRDGLKSYQKDNRPLLGEGVQDYAPCVGTSMLDSTICDIYLINESNQIVGRPVLTACIDAYSGLCNGYSLTWKGGIYSLRNLMLNTISDKVELCRKHGIKINKEEWNSSLMPFRLVTDKGSEYKGENFEQLSDLGITIVNLPSYRPELKGVVEKFFDVIQNYYKPYLKGRGVIEPDYQHRGAHDYRKDASLTIDDFEKVILNCIIYYNSKRIIENFPYTEEMLELGIKPYSNTIWNYGLSKSNLIQVSEKELILCLLPRTTGYFSRQGLRVNGLRYHNENFILRYLDGKDALIAYNPDNANNVFLVENGKYIEFTLIESRFKEKSLEDISKLKDIQKELIKGEYENKLQAEIDLSNSIQAIRNNTERISKVDLKQIRNTRRKEEINVHRDLLEEVCING